MKLIPVDQIPKMNGYHKLQDLIEEFVNGDANDHAFQKAIGCYANYVDIENGDEYWISGLKKAESNRHWAGRGKILIDRRAVPEYLALIGEPKLPANMFEVVELEDCFPVERVRQLLNSKVCINAEVGG